MGEVAQYMGSGTSQSNAATVPVWITSSMGLGFHLYITGPKRLGLAFTDPRMDDVPPILPASSQAIPRSATSIGLRESASPSSSPSHSVLEVPLYRTGNPHLHPLADMPSPQVPVLWVPLYRTGNTQKHTNWLLR